MMVLNWMGQSSSSGLSVMTISEMSSFFRSKLSVHLKIIFLSSATKAKVGFVFNKIGITPEACSSWFLPRVVGLSTALEWCYTAEILESDTLVAAGFAKAAHEPDDLLPAAYAIAKKIVKHSPVAIALTRQMMYRNSAQEHPRDAHNVDSLSIFYSSLGSGKEGVRSFLEKREAVFSDSAKEMPPFYPWWKS